MMTIASVIISLIIFRVMVKAFMPKRDPEEYWHEYAKNNETYVEWDVPDWDYVGTDVNMEEEPKDVD